MCGIVGQLSFSRPVDRVRLEAAAAAQLHRGPDDSGFYLSANGAAGFAQCRLAIIDVSPAGHQPMIWGTGDSEIVINFNGEIYNYRELRAECDAAAIRQRGEVIPWRGSSDTEVILWAYILWGDAMLPKLNGMFALSIWDARSGRMLVARDAFGVKPLYYSLTPERFAFASEMKGLVRLGGIDRELDPVALAQYVSYLYTPGERTMLLGVRKLDPGAAMWVGAKGLERSWNFTDVAMQAPIDESMDEETAMARLIELLEAAVKRQMVADVPVGAYLSGGLDSSSIVNFARKYAKEKRLQCFTIGNKKAAEEDEGWAEDLPFARRVAEHLGVELHTIWVGPEMANHLIWMIYHLDEPQADPAALNAYFIARLARERGMKVLLSGAGGDDIFTGYRRHRALTLEPKWTWLPTGVRRLLRQVGDSLPKDRPIGRRVDKAFQYADWPADKRLAGYFLWLRPSIVHSLFTPEYRSQFNDSSIIAPLLDAIRSLPADSPPLNQMLFLDRRFFLADHNLNYTDKMSMAAGIEVRVPFLDPDLAAFAASLPLHFKQNGSHGKWILKRAMEQFLPHDVVYRPKTGFGVPLSHWLQRELRSIVDDTLAPEALRRRGIFDPKAVQRLLAQERAGRVQAAYPIFALMCIEMWCRIFLDGASVPPAP